MSRSSVSPPSPTRAGSTCSDVSTEPGTPRRSSRTRRSSARSVSTPGRSTSSSVAAGRSCQLLYLGPYLDAIGDEYQPFGVGLDRLDEITAGELLAKDGASDAAIRFNGLRRGDGTQAARNGEVSALFRVWQAAIVKRRGLPVFKREVFRLKGGNQLMTDTFAAKLGERVRLGCPITSIERGDSSVTVHFREFGEPAKLEAEYLVCSIPLAILKKIPVKPDWPESKNFVIRNVVFGSQARVVLQSRTKFWKGDVPSINLETGDPAMYLVYQTADEVPGSRGVLMGSGRRRCHG